MVEGNDAYAVLGVPRGADLREIHRAWRRLVRINHPDRYPPEQRAAQTARTQQINLAWEFIQGQSASQAIASPDEYASQENPVETILRLLRNRIVERVYLPPRNAVTEPLPDGLQHSPAAQGLPRQLYRHQAMALAALLRNENVVVSTGTASGKSLVFQTYVLHRLMLEPESTAIVWYPLKALSNDQMRGWRERAGKAGFPVEQINRIDGDISTSERFNILRGTRIAIMTPDICHAWLLRHRANPAVRSFLKSLRLLVLDEAHAYETVFGSHVALLLRRLDAAHRDEADGNPLHYIAATATILEPAQHLEKLTGAPFTAVTEEDDGAPRQERTLAHIAAASDRGDPLEHALANIILDILQLASPPKFIAFINSRQGAERVVRLVRQKALNLEPEKRDKAIHQVNLVQPYRSGYEGEDRQAIERALREGRLLGVIATSAMELGIDIPNLDLGINAGPTYTRKSLRQRVGRIGRRRPGIFLVLREHDAFTRYGDSLKQYWEKSVEPSHLYLGNEVFHFIHAHCLARESISPKSFEENLNDINWPDGFTHTAWKIWNEQPFPRFDPIAAPVTQGHTPPHRVWHIRDIKLPDHEIVEESNGRRVGRIGAEQAIKETYPGACYLHLKQGWRITGWREQAAGPAIIRARRLSGGTPAWNPRALPEANRRDALPPPGTSGSESRDTYRRTDPIIDYMATVRLNREGIIEGRLTNLSDGILAEAWMDLSETVSGWEEGNRPYRYEDYRRPGLKSQRIEIPTTGVLLQINLPWFSNYTAHRRIAADLLDLLCYDRSIPRRDVEWIDAGILSQNENGGREPLENCVLFYDKVYGGMRLTAALYDNLPEYTQRLRQANPSRPASPDRGAGDIFQLFAEFAQSLSAYSEDHSLAMTVHS